MQKRKRILALVLVLVFSFSVFLVPYASAYTLFGYRMVGGIRNRYFYFDSPTLSTNWKTPFYDAVNKWYNTDTYHAFAETANWNNSQMDFIVEYDPWGGHGETVFYFSSVQGYVYPYNQDWKYCEVFLNDYNIDETTISGRAAGAVTAAHEIGHTIDLNENNVNIYSIMCQIGTRQVSSPSVDDENGTNYLYPNGWY